MGTEERETIRRPFSERRGAPLLLGAAGVLVVLGALQLASRLGIVSTSEVPAPSETIRTFFDQLGSGSFWSLVWETVKAWGLGLAIAAAIGIPLGLVIGAADLLWRALRPTIEFLRPVPSVSLIPLTILVWGNGLHGAVFLTAFGAVWPLLIQAIYGVREIDEVARDTVRCLGLTPLQRIRYLVWPSALPFLATGLQIASSIALIVAVTAELVIGTPGLGNAINLDQAGGDYPLMYAMILATGLLGLTVNLLFGAIERRALRWHPSQRLEAGLL